MVFVFLVMEIYDCSIKKKANDLGIELAQKK
jgi:hypothetical protein